MLLFAHGRRKDALDEWESAIELGLQHPVLLRNAGLAAYNVAHDDETAWRRYEQAVELAPQDARLLFEQDQLADRVGHPAEERLARLRAHPDLVLSRDDFTIEYVGLLVAGGLAGEALEILRSREFHPWEGGEGQAIRAWDSAIAALGLEQTEPPASLGEVRAEYQAPQAVREDGVTDYFATSHPELLLFARE